MEAGVLHRGVLNAFVRLFPVWVTLGGVAALVHPPAFTWFLDLGLITPGLQVIMLGMGLTLEFADFSRVVRAPAAIGWGVLLQYTVMPLLGWGFGYLFALPTPFAVGLVLVSCCPGGTASNGSTAGQGTMARGRSNRARSVIGNQSVRAHRRGFARVVGAAAVGSSGQGCFG